MATNFEMVKAWHQAFGVPVGDKPQLIPRDRFNLRVKLIQEELIEYIEAISDDDLIEIADALADLLYVVYGTAVEHGLPIDEVFKEVQRSNMSKLDEDGKPVVREDGKILKSNLFVEPDIKRVLANGNQNAGTQSE